LKILLQELPQPEITGAFSVYPNPFNSHLSVEFVDESGLQAIKIYSIRGQLLYNLMVNYPVSTKLFEIETSGLPPGTYIIEIISGQNKFVRKVIRR
jgi:hypothetical protein